MVRVISRTKTTPHVLFMIFFFFFFWGGGGLLCFCIALLLSFKSFCY